MRQTKSGLGWTAVLLGLSLILSGCTSLASRIANGMYPNLQTFLDTEAPPTPHAYPASSSILAVIGGRGEGISCSIAPSLELYLFRDKPPKEATVSLQFRQACASHDYCYRHGHATYGYTQSDCDFALQQSAYRICRLDSNEFVDDSSVDACQERARRILAGVAVGGAKHFQHDERSTYFEFDPMPNKADNYATVRWIERAGQADVRGRAMRGQFVVMLYKRGTVQLNQAHFDLEQRDMAVPMAFPYQYIATPPNVVRINGEDRLLGLARDSVQDTNLRVVEYVSDPAGQAIIPFPPGTLDKGASVFWFPVGRPELLAYWSDRGLASVGLVYEPQAGRAAPPAMAMAPDLPRAFEAERYLTLQHMPIDGRFFHAECSETMVLQRLGSTSKAALPKGRNYQQFVQLAALRPGDGKCAAHAPLWLAAPEEMEPLTALRSAEGYDQIVSLAVEKAPPGMSGKQLRLSVFDLAHAGENKDPAAAAAKPISVKSALLQAPLDASWMAQPPQILSEPGNGGSLLFFSRYVGIVEPAKIAKAAAKPGGLSNIDALVRYEFAYFRREGTYLEPPRLRLIGSGVCQLDLAAQAKLVWQQIDQDAPISHLGAGADRIYKLPVEKDAMQQGVQKSASQGENDGQKLKVLNERWANAQVIPGWFVAREDGAAATATAPLDVAVFLRGNAQFALLLAGTNGKPEKGGHGFEAVTAEYARCDPAPLHGAQVALTPP